MRWIMITVASCALAGCTFGLEDQVTFATRNLALDATLEDGAFAASDGTIVVTPMEAGSLDRGVLIRVEGTDADGRRVTSTIEVDGNLGALCPGARVELAERDGQLAAVEATGVPSAMAEQLMGLRAVMWADSQTADGDERIEPARLTLRSAEGADGFSTMSFRSESGDDVDPRQVGGSFDIARFVDPGEVPGWEGDTWNGLPIDAWE